MFDGVYVRLIALVCIGDWQWFREFSSTKGGLHECRSVVEYTLL